MLKSLIDLEGTSLVEDYSMMSHFAANLPIVHIVVLFRTAAGHGGVILPILERGQEVKIRFSTAAPGLEDFIYPDSGQNHATCSFATTTISLSSLNFEIFQVEDRTCIRFAESFVEAPGQIHRDMVRSFSNAMW